MKIHLANTEVKIKDNKVIIVTVLKSNSSCGRKESGVRSTGTKNNKGVSGSIMITDFNSFSNYTERCSCCTNKYNEIILKARELKKSIKS